MKAEVGEKYICKALNNVGILTVKERQMKYQGIKDPIVMLTFEEYDILQSDEKKFLDGWVKIEEIGIDQRAEEMTKDVMINQKKFDELSSIQIPLRSHRCVISKFTEEDLEKSETQEKPTMQRSDFKEITPEMFETCEKMVKMEGKCSGLCNKNCPFHIQNSIKNDSCDTKYSTLFELVESAKEFLKFRMAKAFDVKINISGFDNSKLQDEIKKALKNGETIIIKELKEGLSDENEHLRQCNAKLAEDKEKLNSERDRLAILYDKLKESIEISRKNNAVKFEKIVELEKEIDRLTNNLSVTEKSNLTHKDTISYLDRLVAKLQTEKEELKESNDRIARKLCDIRNILDK